MYKKYSRVSRRRNKYKFINYSLFSPKWGNGCKGNTFFLLYKIKNAQSSQIMRFKLCGKNNNSIAKTNARLFIHYIKIV